MKKIYKKLSMVICIAMLFTMILPQEIFARINIEEKVSMAVTKPTIVAGDDQNVRFNFALENEIKNVSICWKHENLDKYIWFNYGNLEEVISSNQFIAGLSIPDSTIVGQYKVSEISIVSKTGMTLVLNNQSELENYSNLNFTVIADTSKDAVGPTLNRLTMDKHELSMGEKVKYDVSTSAGISGTQSVVLYYKDKDDSSKIFQIGMNTASNDFEYEYTVINNGRIKDGDYKLTSVQLYNNSIGYTVMNSWDSNSFPSTFDFSNYDLKINVGTTEYEYPTLTSINVIDKNVSAPGSAKIVAKAVKGTNDISYIMVTYKQDTGTTICANLQYNPTSKKYEGNIYLGKADRYRGDLTFKDIQIHDTGNNAIVYTTNAANEYCQNYMISQYNGENMSINLTNKLTDNTLPELVSFNWKKDTVNTPGVATLEVIVKEKDSGFDYTSECKAEILKVGNALNISSKYCPYLSLDYEFSNKQENKAAGLYKFVGKYTFPRYEQTKDLYVENITLTDIAGNKREYNVNRTNNNERIENKVLHVVNQNASDIIFLSTRDTNFNNTLKGLSEGKTAVVDVATDSVVKKEVFDSIKGKDITLVFEEFFDNNNWDNQGIQWIINGKDINKPTKDIDVNTSLSNAKYNKYEEKYGKDYLKSCGGMGGIDSIQVSFSTENNPQNIIDISAKYGNYTYEDFEYMTDSEIERINKEVIKIYLTKLIDMYKTNNFNDVAEELSNINTTSKTVDEINNAINNIVEGISYTKINFESNGELPCKSKIRIKTDYATRNLYGVKDLEAYYYNPVTGNNELVADKIDLNQDDYYEFEITHNSEYRLATKGTFGEKTTKADIASSNPKTGRSLPNVGIVSIILGLAVIAYKKK